MLDLQVMVHHPATYVPKTHNGHRIDCHPPLGTSWLTWMLNIQKRLLQIWRYSISCYPESQFILPAYLITKRPSLLPGTSRVYLAFMKRTSLSNISKFMPVSGVYNKHAPTYLALDQYKFPLKYQRVLTASAPIAAIYPHIPP